MISYYLPSGSKIGVGLPGACPRERDGRPRPRGRPCSAAARRCTVRATRHEHWCGLAVRIARSSSLSQLRHVDWSPASTSSTPTATTTGCGAAACPRTCARCTASCFERGAAHPRGEGADCAWSCSGSASCWQRVVADRTVVVVAETHGGGCPGCRASSRTASTCAFPRRRTARRHPSILFVGTWREDASAGKLLAERLRARGPAALSRTPSCGWSPATSPRMCPRAVKAARPGHRRRAGRPATRVRGCSACPRPTRGSASRTPRRWPAGLPVVATPNPGSRFVTDEGRAG